MHVETTGRIFPAMNRTHAKELARQRLLDQGVAMLMQQGYHATGLQDLLNAVKVPKGSFYNYFASKEEFCMQAIEHYIEPFIRRLEACRQASDKDALSALRCYFAGLTEELERRHFLGGCLLGNLMGEIGDTSEVCRETLRCVVGRYRDQLEQALAQAQKEGSVRTDRSARTLADFLIDAWQGALLRMKIEQSVQPLQACWQGLLDDYFRP